jgi:predicted CopG family antitoxin
MRKKLTITLAEDVYDELYRVAGDRKVSEFVESLLRPHLMDDVAAGYRNMAADAEREAEAIEWIEGTTEALSDEAG